MISHDGFYISSVIGSDYGHWLPIVMISDDGL
jgi:hypothetical protein